MMLTTPSSSPISVELSARARTEMRWFNAEIDVLERMAMLAEARPDDKRLAAVLADAEKEIKYLRGVFGAVERGARPMRDFWDGLRDASRRR